MKKRISLLLALVLALALSVPALAEEGAVEEEKYTVQYSNTRDLVDKLEQMNVDYVAEMDEDGDERIDFMGGGDKASYRISCWFEKGDTRIFIRVFSLIKYDPEKLADVVSLMNRLNQSYYHTCWYADESDNTVNVKMDLIVREGNSVGDITVETLRRLINIIDDAYDTVAPFAK